MKFQTRFTRPALSALSRSSPQPSQIAIDASALVELLLRTTLGRKIASTIGGSQLIAPDIVNPEVVQALRGLERGGKLSPERATKAVGRLAESPIRRVPTTGLIADSWALRANLSAYDACYVALARALDCPLLSTDAPLRHAPLRDVRFLDIG